MLLVDCQLSLDVIGWEDETVIGAFRFVYRSKGSTCIIEYVRVNQCVVCLLMSSMSRL